MKNTVTTLQGIYNSELLPKILGLCQHLFPPIIKRACQNSLPALNTNDQDIANINAIVQLKLKKALYLHALEAPPEVFTDHVTHTRNERIEERVSELSRNLSAITQIHIPNASNPLAPAPVFTLIEQSLTMNYGYQPSALQADIEQQFLLLARGFYKKINTFFTPYLSKPSGTLDTAIDKPELIVDAEFEWAIEAQEQAPKDPVTIVAASSPVTQLDHTSDTSATIAEPSQDLSARAQTNTQQLQSKELKPRTIKTPINGNTRQATGYTLDQSRAAIEHTKYFFDHELNAGKIGSHFHALCKRIYITAINYSLITPDAFSKDSDNPFKQVLLHIKHIGIHCREDTQSKANLALADATEAAINQLIKNTLEGDINLQRTITTLSRLIKQFTNAQIITAPTNPDGAASPLAATRTQAQHLIDAIMNDNAPSHSVAAELKQDWVHVLEVIGNTHGVNSPPWGQAIENFIDLLAFKKCSPLPAILAHAVQEQLKLAGLSTVLRTQMPPLKIVPPVNTDKEAGLTSEPKKEVRTHKPAHAVTTKIIQSLQEGMWFDYNDNGVVLRCKLAAIIKSIKHYIFISREGKKVLELHYDDLQPMLIRNELSLCLNVSLNSSLEDVMTNIKNTHSPESA
ncbi:DUF1631 family protein [Marinagarivorans algicola]|uniref:DUF1631 family protein n=1 Tax=Marinagarivorans algicola TaxID=1513270 RepID=UPI0037361EC4